MSDQSEAEKVAADRNVGSIIKDISEKYNLPEGAIKIVDRDGNPFSANDGIEAILRGWGNRP